MFFVAIFDKRLEITCNTERSSQIIKEMIQLGFLKTPFVPEGKVSLAVVDYRISNRVEDSLEREGIECIKTVNCRELYEAVDGHPDMLMLHTGGKRIVMAPNIFEFLAPAFEKKGFAVTKGATWLVRNYPGNIAYNVLRLGNLAFHNLKYTDPEVIRQLEEENTELIHVNQGYTKCSVCVIDRSTAITSDRKLAKTMERHGIECLLIKPGGIELKNLNYGFIGGASGLLSKNQVAFTGNPHSLEDSGRLIEFLNNKGIEVNILSEERLVDFGSIIPLKCF